jgi:hypothetical protein
LLSGIALGESRAWTAASLHTTAADPSDGWVLTPAELKASLTTPEPPTNPQVAIVAGLIYVALEWSALTTAASLTAARYAPQITQLMQRAPQMSTAVATRVPPLLTAIRNLSNTSVTKEMIAEDSTRVLAKEGFYEVFANNIFATFRANAIVQFRGMTLTRETMAHVMRHTAEIAARPGTMHTAFRGGVEGLLNRMADVNQLVQARVGPAWVNGISKTQVIQQLLTRFSIQSFKISPSPVAGRVVYDAVYRTAIGTRGESAVRMIYDTTTGDIVTAFPLPR